MLVDTHAHLDDRSFDNDRDQVIQRASDAGVIIVTVGSDLPSSRAAVALAQAYPQVYAAVGVHPHAASGVTAEVIEELRRLAAQPKVVAIGETGLDYYRNLSPREAQRQSFQAHLTLAADLGLPVIVHNRQADADVLEVIGSVPGVRGVFHAFSSGMDTAQAALDAGFYVAFGGPLTYKNAHQTRAVAAQIPLDRLLVETDCPLLSPVPWRGQRNEPAYVALVADALALVRGLSVTEIEAQTTDNARALFRLPLGVKES